MKIDLPLELDKEYRLIAEEFTKIEIDSEKYKYGFIPENKEFNKRIIKFIVGVLDYILSNYDKLDLMTYQDFLGYYELSFIYMYENEEENYLYMDSLKLGDEFLAEFCWELRDLEIPASKKQLEEIKSKYFQVLESLD